MPGSRHSTPSSTPTTTSAYLTPTEAANGRRATNTSGSSSSHPTNEHPPPEADDHEENRSILEALWHGLQHIPKVQWNIKPHVRVKFRKRFYPLHLTRLTLGMDYDFQTRGTMLKWSWKDRVFGAELHFNKREIGLTKSFEVDKQTRLDVHAALDLHMRRTLLSFRVIPFGRLIADVNKPGFAVRQNVQLDKRLAVRFAARLHLPEARFAAGNDSLLSLGQGDFIIDVDELDFCVFLE